MLTASPKKLRSGAWGALVQSADVSVGDEIKITTRAGKSWDARVDQVIWAGDDTAICATSSLDRPTQNTESYRPRYGVDYCGGRCPVRGHKCTANNPCHDCE